MPRWQVAAPRDGVLLEHTGLQHVLDVSGKVFRAGGNVPLRRLRAAASLAAFATVAACRSRNRSQQAAAIGALPCAAAAACGMTFTAATDEPAAEAPQATMSPLAATSRVSRYLLATGSQQLLLTGGAAVDGALLPGAVDGSASGHPLVNTAKGRLALARCKAALGLSFAAVKLLEELGRGSEAALAELQRFAAAGGALAELSAFLYDWPFEGRLTFYRGCAPSLQDTTSGVCCAISAMTFQPSSAIDSGLQPSDAAIAAAATCANVNMAFLQRSLEWRQQLPGEIAERSALHGIDAGLLLRSAGVFKLHRTVAPRLRRCICRTAGSRAEDGTPRLAGDRADRASQPLWHVHGWPAGAGTERRWQHPQHSVPLGTAAHEAEAAAARHQPQQAAACASQCRQPVSSVDCGSGCTGSACSRRPPAACAHNCRCYCCGSCWSCRTTSSR